MELYLIRQLLYSLEDEKSIPLADGTEGSSRTGAPSLLVENSGFRRDDVAVFGDGGQRGPAAGGGGAIGADKDSGLSRPRLRGSDFAGWKIAADLVEWGHRCSGSRHETNTADCRCVRSSYLLRPLFAGRLASGIFPLSRRTADKLGNGSISRIDRGER